MFYSLAVFGIGIGGTPGNYEEYLNHLYDQFLLGMWDRGYYLHASGAIFHNLYSCVLCLMGVIGIAMLLYFVISIFNITKNIGAKQSRRLLQLYLLGFILMNYYRWSTTCGIAEMIFYSSVLKCYYDEEYCLVS